MSRILRHVVQQSLRRFVFHRGYKRWRNDVSCPFWFLHRLFCKRQKRLLRMPERRIYVISNMLTKKLYYSKHRFTLETSPTSSLFLSVSINLFSRKLFRLFLHLDFEYFSVQQFVKVQKREVENANVCCYANSHGRIVLQLLEWN